MKIDFLKNIDCEHVHCSTLSRVSIPVLGMFRVGSALFSFTILGMWYSTLAPVQLLYFSNISALILSSFNIFAAFSFLYKLKYPTKLIQTGIYRLKPLQSVEMIKYKIGKKLGSFIWIAYEVGISFMLTASILYWSFQSDIHSETAFEIFNSIGIHFLLPLLGMLDLLVSRIHIELFHAVFVFLFGCLYLCIYFILGEKFGIWLYSFVSPKGWPEWDLKQIILLVVFIFTFSLTIHLILTFLTHWRRRKTLSEKNVIIGIEIPMRQIV